MAVADREPEHASFLAGDLVSRTTKRLVDAKLPKLAERFRQLMRAGVTADSVAELTALAAAIDERTRAVQATEAKDAQQRAAGLTPRAARQARRTPPEVRDRLYDLRAAASAVREIAAGLQPRRRPAPHVLETSRGKWLHWDARCRRVTGEVVDATDQDRSLYRECGVCRPELWVSGRELPSQNLYDSQHHSHYRGSGIGAPGTGRRR